MKRHWFFLYGVTCYLMFLSVFLYMLGFVGGLGVPKTIDSAGGGVLPLAVAVNVGLLLLFAVQHSVMARPGFKQIWQRVVPDAIERSTYVLLANVVCIVLMWQWRGIDLVVWDIEQPALRAVAWGLFGVGWATVLVATLMIDHFDLFGLRQVWLYWRKRDYTPLPFRVPLFYRHVRHPLYVGWTIAFWATPTMTVGHALFASVMTVYMALAAIVEERDLIAHFGRQYAEYRRRVPMFVPRLRRRGQWSVASGQKAEVREPVIVLRENPGYGEFCHRER